MERTKSVDGIWTTKETSMYFGRKRENRPRIIWRKRERITKIEIKDGTYKNKWTRDVG